MIQLDRELNFLIISQFLDMSDISLLSLYNIFKQHICLFICLLSFIQELNQMDKCYLEIKYMLRLYCTILYKISHVEYDLTCKIENCINCKKTNFPPKISGCINSQPYKKSGLIPDCYIPRLIWLIYVNFMNQLTLIVSIANFADILNWTNQIINFWP